MLHTPANLSEAIAEDGRMLREVCGLLRARRSPAEWPAAAREALRAALNPEPGQRREIAKAAKLERHLFGTVRQPRLDAGDEPAGRIADRLRADLADLVPFGAGFYLIDYNEVVAEWTAPNISH
jgi:hypothetical protein